MLFDGNCRLFMQTGVIKFQAARLITIQAARYRPKLSAAQARVIGPVLWRRGHAGVPISFSQTGNGAPGGARGFARPPHGQTLAIGFARTPFGSGVMSPAPGAPPSLRSEGAAPPGAPFGSSVRHERKLDRGRGMSPRAPHRRRPVPPRDGKGPMAGYGYIFLTRMIVKSAASAAGAVRHDVAHQVAHVVLQIPDDVLDDVSDRDHAHDLAGVKHR